ncbi:hypothetical protein HMPREF0262_02743 [Clostridium sp. ATCC 29733]|nr:hypothetical protein HMPREF0262_02743 [Clostridium sp. ATCC 29733]
MRIGHPLSPVKRQAGGHRAPFYPTASSLCAFGAPPFGERCAKATGFPGRRRRRAR